MKVFFVLLFHTFYSWPGGQHVSARWDGTTDGTEPVSAILDGKFFSIVSQTPDGKVQAECKLCTKKKAVISGTLLATSNFKTHLKRLHPDSLDDFEKHKTECRPNYSGKKANTPYRQTCLFEHTVTQGKLDSLITSYIVKGMHPLSTVEQTEFVELIHGLNPNLTVISRRTLRRKIEVDFNAKKRDLKEKLKTVQYVCTTAD